MNQYIITEDDFKELGEFFQRLIDGDNPGLIQIQVWQKRVRSHPYNPPSYGDFIQDRCKCKKTECVDYKSDLCSPWKCNHYLKSACKDDRDKMLDEIWQKILSETNDRSFVDTDGDYQQCTGLSIDELEFVIKEHRQSKVGE
jgi:hypothetical protein